MNTQRLIDKLTSWPVTLTVCLLIVLGTLTVKLWPRTVPFDQCSVAYQTYANQPSIRAAFIKDYRINDTVFVDVTFIEATTDSAWNVILNDFNMPVIPEEYRELVEKNSSIEFNLISKEDPQKIDEDIDNNDVLVLSRQKHSVCIFHINNKIQRNAIIRNKLDEI